MEFDFFPILSYFLLVVVVSHAYFLPSPGKSSTDTNRDVTSVTKYDTVYENLQKTEGSSYDSVYNKPQKYDAVHGISRELGGSSTDTPNGFKSLAAYTQIYGASQYTSVYENSEKVEENSVDVHNDASSVAGYNAVYGGSQKVQGSSIDTPNDFRSVSSISESNPGQGGDDGSAFSVFLEKDLKSGTKMTVSFTKTSSTSHFLPRKVAESLPFSSDKLPEILNRFSVKENSEEAKVIENTIKECEKPAMKGEDKYCARSMGSVINFSISKLGKNIQMVPNTVEAENQEYEFGEGIEKIGEKSVVCHQLNYPYAVALCHIFQNSKIYRIPLTGGDGSRVRALAVCHEDTSSFDPNALALRLLNVKPGTLPICHLLPNGHFVWVPK